MSAARLASITGFEAESSSSFQSKPAASRRLDRRAVEDAARDGAERQRAPPPRLPARRPGPDQRLVGQRLAAGVDLGLGGQDHVELAAGEPLLEERRLRRNAAAP